MPVEIRELVIRAVVSDPRKQDVTPKDLQASAKEKEAIIEECVRQVLKILKKSQER